MTYRLLRLDPAQEQVIVEDDGEEVARIDAPKPGDPNVVVVDQAHSPRRLYLWGMAGGASIGVLIEGLRLWL